MAHLKSRDGQNTSWENDAVLLAPEDVCDFNEGNILPLPAAELANVRTWLQPTDYEGDGGELRKHTTAHLDGTCKWLLEGAAYHDWQSAGNEQRLLWIRGIPGAGKSVIAASLIETLRQEGVPVLFFFFRHIIAANHEPIAAVRDWLAQLLPFSPPLQLKLNGHTTARRTIDSLDSAELWLELRSALQQIPKAYVVVDALDEMSHGSGGDGNVDETLSFLGELAELTRCCQTSVVMTSRPVAYIESALRRLGRGTLISIQLDETLVDKDIATYVQHRLVTAPVTISNDDQAIIGAAVPGRANGLFLYAKLAMDAFTSPGADVRLVLEGLPQDLNVMYTDLLSQHALRSGVDEETQLLILQLVTHAARPLRVLEIARLICVLDKRASAEEKKGRNLGETKELVRVACGPLLEILQDETVSVIHHSLTEFLTDDDLGGRGGRILDCGATHQRLALVCLAYLQSEILGRPQKPYNEFWAPFMDFYYPDLQDDTFAKYAGSNWFVHARKATHAGYTDQTEMTLLLDDILGMEHSSSQILAMSTGSTSFGLSKKTEPTPVYVATVLQLQGYLDVLLSREAKMNMSTDSSESPVYHATQNGHIAILEALLRAGADPGEHDKFPFSGLTPLHQAVEHNNPVAAKLLLDAGADMLALTQFRDPSSYGHKDTSPLEWVCKRGHMACLEVFMPHFPSQHVIGQAVLWSAETARANMLSALLLHPLATAGKEEGEGPWSRDLNRALVLASAERDPPSVRALLLAGADATASHEEPGFLFDNKIGPLHAWAAASPSVGSSLGSAHEEYLRPLGPMNEQHEARAKDVEGTTAVFRMLLAAGADVNMHKKSARGTHGAPLHYARDVVAARLLIEEGGADIFAVSTGAGTLLSMTRDPAMVEYLLGVLTKATDGTSDENLGKESGKVSVTSQIDAAMLDRMKQGWSSRLNTASIIAQVQLFLNHGVDPATAVSHDGQTALHLLVQLERAKGSTDEATDGRVALLHRLLQYPGIDINGRNAQGHTPFQLMGSKYPGRTDKIHDNRELFAALLAAGAEIEVHDSQGRTPLFSKINAHRSMNSSDDGDLIATCEAMVREGSRLDTRDVKGRTLCHAAVTSTNSPKVVQWLCGRGLDPRAVDNDGNTLFHETLRDGRWADVAFSSRARGFGFFEALRDLGVDPTQPNHVGTTPLHILSTIAPMRMETNMQRNSGGSSAALDWFLQRHIDAGQGDVDAADQDSITSLHNAATFSEYMTHQLLQHGANPLKETKEGLNGFHLAARAQQVNILGMMLEKVTASAGQGVVVTSNIHHRSPLFYAVRSGQLESVKLLLEASMSSVVHEPSDDYQDSLLEAVVEFEEEFDNWPRHAKYQKLDPRDVGSVTLGERFRKAIQRGPRTTKMIDEILDMLAKHDLISAKHIDTAISAAVERKAAATLPGLLRVRDQIREPRDVAFHKDHDSSVTALFEAKKEARKPFEDVIVANGTLMPAEFEAAMKAHHFDIVAKALSKSPAMCLRVLNDDIGDHNGSTTLLQYLAQTGHADLLSKVATKEAIARLEDAEWVAKTSLESRARRDYLGGEIEPLLITACRRETPNMDVVRLLVEKFQADVNALGAGGKQKNWSHSSGPRPTGNSALHVLATGDHWWQAALGLPYLLAHGADVNIRAARTSRAGETSTGGGPGLMSPLNAVLEGLVQHSSLGSNRRAIETLLEHGADVLATDDQGVSCLDRGSHDPEIHKLLLRYTTRIISQNLIKAIDSGSTDALRALLVAGADPNGMASVMGSRSTSPVDNHPFQIPERKKVQKFPLHHVLGRSYDGRRECAGTDVQAKMADQLLEHGADPFAKYDGSTLLHKVFPDRESWRPGSCLRRILDMESVRDKLDADSTDGQGVTLFHLACRAGVENKTQEARDDLAAAKSPASILLGLGADVYAKDHAGRNALHYLLAVSGTHVDVEMVRRICRLAPELVNERYKNDSNMYSSDDRRSWGVISSGRAPLHEAVAQLSWSDTEIVDILLEEGADPTLADAEGNTPLHLLLGGQFRTCCTSSALLSGDISLDSNAAVTSGVILNRLLAVPGVDINAPNKAGETPIFRYLSSGKARCADYRLYDAGRKMPRPEEVAKWHVAVLDFFDALGADWGVRCNTSSGKTLMHAAVEGHSRSRGPGETAAQVKYLIGKGVDPSAEDHSHKTALDYAATLEASDVLELFG